MSHVNTDPAATQTKYPWRATARTVLEATVAAAAASPLVYQAITQESPEAATGAALTFLGVAGAITRVAALPVVESFLQRFLPWLAAKPYSSPPHSASTSSM